MKELARGLVDGEYWDLVSVVLIEAMEEAKGTLESETTSDKDLRINQGKAIALRNAFNFFLELARTAEETDGKAS